MNPRASWVPLLVAGLLFVLLACGKKGPPELPHKGFSLRVADLTGEWDREYVLLKGKVRGAKDPGEPTGLITGCRVYYAQYSMQNPPCEGCPIEYRSHQGFGPEVIREGGFLCRVPGKMKGQIYYLKVSLIGPGGVMGPESETVRVGVQ